MRFMIWLDALTMTKMVGRIQVMLSLKGVRSTKILMAMDMVTIIHQAQNLQITGLMTLKGTLLKCYLNVNRRSLKLI